MAAFECDGCGACCKTFPIFAADADSEREPRIAVEGRHLAPHLRTPRWRYQLFPLPFLDVCCFLAGDNLCGIYPTRPDVCRAFAAGGDQCQEARGRQGLPPLVPPGQSARQ